MQIETIGDATLYCADCMDVLPTLERVDAVITDPPYGIGFKYDGEYVDVGGEPYIEFMSSFNHIPSCILQYPEEMISLIVPAFGNPNKIITWCYNSNTARQHRQVGFFGLKPDLTKLKFPAKNLGDARVNALVSSYDWWSDIQQVKNVSKEKTEHPCQAPLELYRRIITVLPDAKNILDPFLGSGTTGVAAIQLGRKFIGIEREERYFQIACERISNAVAQGQLFEPVREKQIQESLL
jgi:DNA modification methylase